MPSNASKDATMRAHGCGVRLHGSNVGASQQASAHAQPFRPTAMRSHTG